MKPPSLRATPYIASLLCGAIVFIFAVFESAWREPHLLEKAFVLTLLLCTWGALLFASVRLATSLLISGGLFLLLKFISITKLRYLESTLMPADFIYFARTSLLETLEHYPHFLGLGIAMCILIPTGLILIWWTDRPLMTRMPFLPRAAARLAGTATCIAIFLACLLPHGPFSEITQKAMWYKLSDGAHLTNFFATIRDSEIRLPSMSNADAAELEWKDTAIPHSANHLEGHLLPDIIQVLEESTFDPSIFMGCDIPQCRVSMFQQDERTRAHGPLRTHTAGGGTWVSEFSVLTGIPQDIFGPSGMYAPYTLAPRVQDTLPKFLSRIGYLTIAIYPVGGNFINARNAYRAYGFDRFYDINDLGLTAWHTSDSQLFAAAKRIYDKVKKPKQPVFIMILTMEQHGPHDSAPLSSLTAPFNEGLIHDLPNDQALNLTTYLARLHKSDVGMSQLEHDFLDRPDPTVLVHFGDHQPSFGGLIRKMQRTLSADEQPYREYLTYYMIKSNFAEQPLSGYPVLDIAYLPSMVLQTAGLPMDPYFSALASFRDRCKGLYDDCADKSLIASYYAWIFGQLHELE